LHRVAGAGALGDHAIGTKLVLVAWQVRLKSRLWDARIVPSPIVLLDLGQVPWDVVEPLQQWNPRARVLATVYGGRSLPKHLGVDDAHEVAMNLDAGMAALAAEA